MKWDLFGDHLPFILGVFDHSLSVPFQAAIWLLTYSLGKLLHGFAHDGNPPSPGQKTNMGLVSGSCLSRELKVEGG